MTSRFKDVVVSGKDPSEQFESSAGRSTFQQPLVCVPVVSFRTKDHVHCAPFVAFCCDVTATILGHSVPNGEVVCPDILEQIPMYFQGIVLYFLRLQCRFGPAVGRLVGSTERFRVQTVVIKVEAP